MLPSNPCPAGSIGDFTSFPVDFYTNIYIYIESPLKKKTIKTHINHDETAKSADFQ
jgi:hypothetical protein